MQDNLEHARDTLEEQELARTASHEGREASMLQLKETYIRSARALGAEIDSKNKTIQELDKSQDLAAAEISTLRCKVEEYEHGELAAAAAAAAAAESAAHAAAAEHAKIIAKLGPKA